MRRADGLDQDGNSVVVIGCDIKKKKNPQEKKWPQGFEHKQLKRQLSSTEMKESRGQKGFGELVQFQTSRAWDIYISRYITGRCKVH